jgi:hypothetical protein
MRMRLAETYDRRDGSTLRKRFDAQAEAIKAASADLEISCVLARKETHRQSAKELDLRPCNQIPSE